jgi:hypothetical protein
MSDEANINNSESTAPDQTVSTATPETVASTPDLLSQIPEDLRNEPSLKNIKDLGSLAKSYVSAQRMLGSSVRIPGPDASEEVKADFYNKVGSIPGVVKLPDPNDKASVDAFYEKLGRPKTADEYVVKVPEEIAAYIEPEKVNGFKQLAHNLGLNKQQTEALTGFYMSNTQADIQRMAAQKNNTEAELKQVWGADYDARLNAAKDVARHFSAKFPNEVTELVNSPAGRNKVFLMMAAELGKSYKESGVIQGDSNINFGLTPDEAKARIAEMRNNKAHDVHSDDPRKREAAVEKMNQLYKAAYPDQG